jgi:pimeloyl-ACP methyl ester carboxylesterase
MLRCTLRRSVFAAGLLTLGICGCTRAPEQVLDVDAGGHRLHLLIAGDHGPTVVLESGLPGGLGWGEIRRAVGRFARVVTYDRAGIGQSELGPQPRNAEQIAKELHTALHNTDLSPPYLLVGQSMGGPYMRVFAAKYPNETCGLVLVDPTHAEEIEPLDVVGDWFAAHHPDRKDQIEALCAGAPEGTEALLKSSFKDVELAITELPESQREAVRSEWYALLASTPQSTVAPTLSPGAREELKAAMDSLQQAVAARPLPPIPIILIAAGRLDAHSEITAGFSPNTRTLHELFRNWKTASYQKWVDATPSAKLWIARRSGHNIQSENPRIIVNAIRDVMERAGHADGTNR